MENCENDSPKSKTEAKKKKFELKKMGWLKKIVEKKILDPKSKWGILFSNLKTIKNNVTKTPEGFKAELKQARHDIRIKDHLEKIKKIEETRDLDLKKKKFISLLYYCVYLVVFYIVVLN